MSRLRTVIVVVLLFSAVPAWATEAERVLHEAFLSYCGTVTPPPEICTNYPSLAHQYLVLDVLCPATGSAFCSDFTDAHNQTGGNTLAPLVLALDHETGRWSTHNRLAGAGMTRVKLDVAGEPTVSLARDERVTLVVENTNPLLYGAVAGKPTEVDTPELATIQKLLSALGGNIASFIRVLGATDVAKAAAGTALKDYSDELKVFAEELEKVLVAVECRAGQTAVQTSRAVTFIQSLELGKSGEYLLKPPTPSNCPATATVLASEVANAFDQLQTLLFAPQDRPEDCAARLDAFRAMATADPADPAKVRTAISGFEQVAPCSSTKLDKWMSTGVGDIKELLEEAAAALIEMRANAAELAQLEAVAKPIPEQKQRRDELRKEKAEAEKLEREKLKTMRKLLATERKAENEILEASNLARQVASLRKDAEAILAKRDDVHKAAAQVEVFERRLDRYRIGAIQTCGSPPVDCINSASIDPRLILEPQLKDVRQTKIQKHSVTVKPDSPYASKVVATRPAELKGDYQLDSVLRGLWGISASVIYTDLASPTFAAVTSEDDTSEDDAEKKVIALTDETTRAGEIAILADFRLGRWLACRKAPSQCGSKSRLFGVEFGARVGDDPAFFAGISLRPSRSWRLGLGYTYQQVKELRKGQEPGQVVASTDDIRTRDVFEGELYISLSFALESLSLFSSGD